MSKEDLKGMSVITRLPNTKTQTDCKEEFVDLLRDVLSNTTLIDLGTPSSSIEPEWWLDMMEFQKQSINLIEKYTKK